MRVTVVEGAVHDRRVYEGGQVYKFDVLPVVGNYICTIDADDKFVRSEVTHIVHFFDNTGVGRIFAFVKKGPTFVAG